MGIVWENTALSPGTKLPHIFVTGSARCSSALCLFLISLYVSHSKITIRAQIQYGPHFQFPCDTWNSKIFEMKKLPTYWVQTHKASPVYVSQDNVKLSCYFDIIYANYHHSYAETHLIFTNKTWHLVYKNQWKSFKSRHIH